MPDSKKILITGTAGFIGFHLAERMINEGYDVYGLDVINDYYNINLKYARLEEHGISKSLIDYNQVLSSSKHPNYKFIKLDLADHEAVVYFMMEQKFDYVVFFSA